ncbi:MAG: thermonuclease family protein [Verrucomicrobiaceae bacterium]
MKKSKLKTILAGILVVAAIAIKFHETYKSKDDPGYTKRTEKSEVTSKKDERQGKFYVLYDCEYIPDTYNDGDSFKIKTSDGRVVELRMYFVDTAESKDKPYADHRKRVGQQGDYFGGLDYKTTLKLGEAAKKFAASGLKGKELTVYTMWEEVYTSGRFYAFVEVEGEGFWHETLVKEGLARIHTKGEETPDGTSRRNRESELRKLEATAKRAKRGGWGM